MSKAEELEKFDQEIQKYSIQGHWKMGLPANMEPRSKLKPMLWKGSVIRDTLMRAGDLIGVAEAGRRTIQLVNPGMAPKKFTTHTLQMSVQMVLPGEVATAHRHTMAAIRFVVEGKDTFTTVNGESFLMEPGDLVLTPNWTWHDHINKSDGPMIWIDGLDVPFSQAMDVMFIEDHEKPQQTVQREWKKSDDGKGHDGGARWYYKWQESEKRLRQMAERSGESSGDLILDYTGQGGAPTLPTMSCGLHLLRQGERGKNRRHTSSGIFHVVRGRGRTVVNDEVLEWEKGDYLVIPNWTWHRHENRSLDEEACLFFMSDRPLYEPFGLYREEFQG